MKSVYRVRRAVLVLLSLCLITPMVYALTVEELLGELPAKDSAHAVQLYESVVAGDASLIASLCDSVVLWKEGADPKIPMALHGLTNHIMRPKNGAHRSRIVRLYEAALGRTNDPENQRFFMSLLRICGDKDSVTVLAPYLCDTVVFDDAIQTLEAIGGEEAVTLLENTNCPDMPEAFSVAVKTVLMRMANSVAYERNTTGLDTLLLAAAVTPPELEDRKGVAALCRKALKDKEAEPHVQALALRALVNTEGVDALPDLVQAGESPEPVVWGMALQLSDGIPGAAVSRAWIGQLKHLPEVVRPQLIYMLGGRDDRSARGAVRKALMSKDIKMRLAACDAVGRYDVKEGFMGSLERALADAESKKEIAAVKGALLQFPVSDLTKVVARRVVQGDRLQQIAYLEIIASRRIEEALKSVRKCLKSEEEQVRCVALDTVAVIGTPDDMPSLFEHLLTEESDQAITAARNAIAAVADMHALRPAATKQIQTIFKDTDFESRVRLLKVLDTLGDTAALDEVGKIAESAIFGEEQDMEVGTLALETLGTWKQVRAWDLLLTIFERVETEEIRMTVLQQIIIAAPRVFNNVPQQVKFLEKAQAVCTTDAEKQAVTEALEASRSTEKK
ncbi:MAG: hypothetical protein KAH38_12335 [Candidatus Hydrogenedentes bacterium]|nr:hypothetical protein [Candidatus Hydrogenedentota bacterium]